MTYARKPQALIAFPPQVAQEEAEIKAFLKQHMYRHPAGDAGDGRGRSRSCSTCSRAIKTTLSDLPAEWLEGTEAETEAERARRIGNFIAGMTDRFALIEHQRLFDSTPDLR